VSTGPVFEMTYRTDVHHGADGLKAVREHWEALAHDALDFVQLPQWVENLDPQGVCWLSVTDQDRPVAQAALSLRHVRALGRNLRVLGGVRQVLGSTYGASSPLGALAIADPKADHKAVAASLLDGCHLVGEHWDVLWLSNLREGSPWLACDGHIKAEADLGAPVIETTMPASRHWASESGHLKNTVSSSQRRLEREGLHGFILEARTPGHVAVAFGKFMTLDERSAGRSAGFAGQPEAAEALRRFLVDAARSRRVVIRSLLIDDRPAACQLTVQVQDTLYLMRTAYDDSLQHLSPGDILMAELISKACDDPTINRIDCWERGWHDRWASVIAPMFRLVAFNHRSASGLAAKAVWRSLATLNIQPSSLGS
jgi:CelD/BcsL family acetyltransferase involved in cellulose biosynthesis